MYEQDTIAAIATARGPAGIGIVRVSGPQAGEVADAVVAGRRSAAWQSHRLYAALMVDRDDMVIDRGLAVLMRAPHSYTGEDVLELHCHGSPAVLDRVLEAVLCAGARPAAAGEFTKRAFLNGKIDLVQAEAIADLVNARSAADARLAAEQLRGGLSRRLNTLRDRLLAVKAKFEVQIDFADEELDGDEVDATLQLKEVLAEIEELLQTYRYGQLARRGIRVAIVGRPNVGKSSLFNALLGNDRAIVTATPGTTRDVIEENADFEGLAVTLCDTAGLRQVPDDVERLGVERARQAATASEVRLVVMDRSLPPDIPAEMFDVDQSIAVLNKIDLPTAWREEDVANLRKRCPVVEVSATERVGLDELRKTVVTTVGGTPVDGLPTLSRARQHDALAKARDCLTAVTSGLNEGAPIELMAADVQAALHHIGCVTGEVTSEDVLDRIFSEFCVGK